MGETELQTVAAYNEAIGIERQKRAGQLLRVRLASALDRTALLPTNVVVEQVDLTLCKHAKQPVLSGTVGQQLLAGHEIIVVVFYGPVPVIEALY
jgi:hypothetical protein